MKVLYIVGNRPQFIKLAVLHHQMKNHSSVKECIIHTGQHFSADMSDIFFDELLIDIPTINLNINSLSHIAMIGGFLEFLEPEIRKQDPDLIIVFGDTNTTLAGALAGKKLNYPVAHVEAGIRTYQEDMPEESNRYLTDRMSLFNFCCTPLGMENLINEGFGTSIQSKLVLSGDIMLDAYQQYYEKFVNCTRVVDSLPVSKNNYVLSTIHRRQNTEANERLENIISALNEIHQEIKVVCPVHPNTLKKIEQCKVQPQFLTMSPLGYLDMQNLLHHSKYVITDSGGLQREAFFANKPLLILMDKPFWPEVIQNGCALNCDAQKEKIISVFAALKGLYKRNDISAFGNGIAAQTIANQLVSYFSQT